MSQQNLQASFPPTSHPSTSPETKGRRIINLLMLTQIMKHSKNISSNLKQQYEENMSKYQTRSIIMSFMMNGYLFGNILCRGRIWWKLTTKWPTIINRFLTLYLIGTFNSSLEAAYGIRFYNANERYFQENWDSFAAEFNYKRHIVSYGRINQLQPVTPTPTQQTPTQQPFPNFSNLNVQKPPAYPNNAYTYNQNTNPTNPTNPTNQAQNLPMNSSYGYEAWGGQYNPKSNEYSSNRY